MILSTRFTTQGFYPIVYTNSSYNNDEVLASVAWNNVDTGVGLHSGLRTYQWLARPAGDIVNGATSRVNERDGVSRSLRGLGRQLQHADQQPRPRRSTRGHSGRTAPSRFPAGSTAQLIKTAANGNIEFVKDFLVPALWTNSGSGDWSTVSNWNSNNPLRDADPSNVAMGPVSRLPNSLDWVQLRNTGGGTITLSSGAHTVRKLTTQQPLNMTGGSLTVVTFQVVAGEMTFPPNLPALSPLPIRPRLGTHDASRWRRRKVQY